MSVVVNLDKDIFTVTNILTEEECRDLIAKGEGPGFGAVTFQRNKEGDAFEDPAFAGKLWKRVFPFAPLEIEGWRAVQLGGGFHFSRYDAVKQFQGHRLIESSSEKSLLSLLIYLNDGYTGGETVFLNHCDERIKTVIDSIKVAPKVGMGLFFGNQYSYKGLPVTHGRKYLLRTFVVYASLESHDAP